MATKGKSGTSGAKTSKPADKTTPKAEEKPSPAPTQTAQVKPASDPTPSCANTVGKICPNTSPNTAAKPAEKKVRTKAERDADIAKYEQERKEALKRGDQKAADEAERKALEVMDERKTLGDVGQEVGGILGTIAGAWFGRGRRAPPSKTTPSPAPAPAPKPAPPPPPAPHPAPPPAGPKPANGGGGGYSKKPPRFKDCGKFGKHKDNKKLSKKGELNSDHVPSGAALKKAYIEQLEQAGVLKDLQRSGKLDSVLERMYNEAPTISTPEDVHKEGRTYGGKNTKKQSDADSKDLNGAAKKDTEAAKKSMEKKDPGCVDEYNKAAEKLEKFDFRKFFDEQMKTDPDIGKVLKRN
jgi:hypothetical protein